MVATSLHFFIDVIREGIEKKISKMVKKFQKIEKKIQGTAVKI